MSVETFEQLKNHVALKRMPVLTLDERWYQLVPEKDKTDKIKKLEKKLNDLMKRQGQVNNDIKEVKKIKTQLIQGVVDHMENDETDSKHEKRMSASQRLIFDAKEKITSLEMESEDIPNQIAEANQELLIETLKYCYDKMNQNTHDIEKLDKWIHDTRMKLKKNLLIKQDKEAINDMTYFGMHNILGPELMGIIDRMNEQ